MAVGELAGAYADPDLGAFDLGFVEDGVQVRRSLALCWGFPFEGVKPVRPFRWPKGGKSFAGWYFCATTGEHIGYESWLERDRLILLDADPHVVGIASQPFWLHWHDGERRRRHAPDYFVRLASGRARIVDVRAADRVDDAAAEAFTATERACRAVDWEFLHAGVADPVLMANMRWLSRYRRRRCLRRDVAARLLEVFDEPGPLREGAVRVGDPLLVLPVLFHLLWSGVLETDVDSRLLGPDSMVHATGEL
ncbi:TnsA-like heteromeric transposase endonuclease subunit [Streptomyces sp. SP18ES09]|uniref:TnsA-like heteromeric transposase endonuclease subunit n=1 Tax=Streptomyces sp. SP18ES09 TaxID=3002532 RepID=UPI002E788303|nr:TnsA-like heteromeric transposase endonuclease subunit [Streptomyces sp. SP18ES09]MEE1819687.1 TnsA-like heteromeric transposase endonuclease subunit [Streptomyces sp. SP18ES09]